MGEIATVFRRTWARQRRGGVLLAVRALRCGCRWDNLSDRMWEPCRMHEAEGHLSAVSVQDDGMAVARCLVRDCPWRTDQVSEIAVVLAAQDHWAATREERLAR